jgi:hypothetical protein
MKKTLKKILTITAGVLTALILFAAGCTALVNEAIDDIEWTYSCLAWHPENENREFVTRENDQGQTEARWTTEDEWHVIAENGYDWTYEDQCGEIEIFEWSCPTGTEHENREFVTRENDQGQTEARWSNEDESYVIAEDGFDWTYEDQCGEWDF